MNNLLPHTSVTAAAIIYNPIENGYGMKKYFYIIIIIIIITSQFLKKEE
jgi:hypothetical protein